MRRMTVLWMLLLWSTGARAADGPTLDTTSVQELLGEETPAGRVVEGTQLWTDRLAGSARRGGERAG